MSNEPKTPPSERPQTDDTTPTSWTGVSSVIGETLEDPGATVSTPRPAEATPAPDTANDAPPLAADALERATADETPAPASPTAPPATSDDHAPVVDPLPSRLWKEGELKLVIEQGMSVGKEFLISEADMTVGRRDPEQQVTPDIDLFDQEAPNNRYISRRQARLFLCEGQLMLEDLDSSNGTALNGQLVAAHEPRALTLNDKVHFGQSVLLRVKAV